jgi:hypothetical protein
MRFLSANTICKFVNQFSFIGNKSHKKVLRMKVFYKNMKNNKLHQASVNYPVSCQHHVKMYKI